MHNLRVAAFALLLTLSASLHALELTGRDLFIPSAGRAPGANGTMWQTDLVITNLSPEYANMQVRVDFRSEGITYAFDVQVPTGQSVVIEDFARTRFGRDVALGTVRITAGTTDAQITAQAIVHNVGGNAPLGQTVHALPVGSLEMPAIVGGLQVEGGHRSNIGVGNPHDEPVQVQITSMQGGRGTTVTVPPRSNIQWNAATLRMTEGDTLTFVVTAQKPVYAYGSVIRGGDGDPQFVLPVAIQPGETFAVQPSCPNPAELNRHRNPAPGWIVVFHEGQDVAAVTAQLAERHGFTPLAIYAAIGLGFYAELSPQQLATLRCEPVVDYIEQNAWAHIAGTTAQSLQR
jgi:hypothetical protein